MPLDAEAENLRLTLERLDDPVWRPCGDPKAPLTRQSVAVKAVDARPPGPSPAGKQAVRLDDDLMREPVGHLLREVRNGSVCKLRHDLAAQAFADQLHSVADPEQRLARLQGFFHQLPFK